jgi:hypothetical protein
MSTRVSKPRSRKSKRVAAVFTGVAACAAAFTPAAAAATVQHATAPAGTSPARTARSGKAVSVALPRGHFRLEGGTEKGSCGYHTHWVHLTYSNGETVCYGGVGSIRFSSPQHFTEICGGNNYGFYVSPNLGTGTYHQGTTYARLPTSTVRNGMSRLVIQGYSHLDKCP